MGAYLYCTSCDAPLKAPWGFDNEVIVKAAVLGEFPDCPHCGAEAYYHREDFLTEMAQRLTERKEEI